VIRDQRFSLIPTNVFFCSTSEDSTFHSVKFKITSTDIFFFFDLKKIDYFLLGVEDFEHQP